MSLVRQVALSQPQGGATMAGRSLLALWLLSWLSPAAAQAQSQAGGGTEFFIFMLVLFGIMYFMMIRPQVKKAKQHREMLEALGKGDEVATTGGLIGRILDIGDNFLLLELHKGTQVKLQKTAVHAVLPKGSVQKL